MADHFNRLPAETVREIFTLAFVVPLESWWEVYSDRSEPQYPASLHPYAWLLSTLACCRWRTIAIECTALWQTLPIMSSQQTSIALDRSKSSPLDVTAVLSEDEIIRQDQLIGLSTALQQLCRVRSLRISFVEGTRAQLIPEFGATMDAPILEHLEAHNVPLVATIGNLWNAPCLTRIEMYVGSRRLDMVALNPWKVIQVLARPSIKHLVWNTCAYRGGPYESEILPVLRQLPHLEYLHLHLSQWSGDLPLAESSRVAKFPQLLCLRQIILSGHISHCSGLLESIQYSTDQTKITVYAEHPVRIRQPVQGVWLLQHIIDCTEEHISDFVSPLVTVSIMFDEEGLNMTIHGWRTLRSALWLQFANETESRRPQQYQPPETDVFWAIPLRFHAQHIGVFARSISPGHIQVLSLYEPHSGGNPPLLQVLAVMPNIHTLLIGSATARDIYDTVFGVQPRGTDKKLRRQVLPNLNKLFLARISFAGRNNITEKCAQCCIFVHSAYYLHEIPQVVLSKI